MNDKKIKLNSAINKSINPEIQPGYPFTYRGFWSKIDQDNRSFLCIEVPLSDSGVGGSIYQYYLVENAFDSKASPVLYYYFFEKDIIPITSAHY